MLYANAVPVLSSLEMNAATKWVGTRSPAPEGNTAENVSPATNPSPCSLTARVFGVSSASPPR
jgi:hypothetical protein